MKYEIWLFMLNITNSEKIKLLKKYKDEKTIYEEFEKIRRCSHVADFIGRLYFV